MRLSSISTQNVGPCRTIQASELSKFESKVSEDIRCGVINIAVSVPPICQLAVLLQCIEFSIHPNMLSNFVSLQELKPKNICDPICFNKTLPYPRSCIDDEDGSAIRMAIEAMGIICEDLDNMSVNDTTIPSADIIRVPVDGHNVYVLHHKPDRVLMLFLPHIRQFDDEEKYESLMKEVKSKFPRRYIRYVGCSRYYGSVGTSCCGSEILRALVLAMMCPLSIIKPIDLQILVTDESLKLVLNNILHLSQETRDAFEEDPVGLNPYSCEDEDVVPIISIRFDGSDGNPEVLSIEPSDYSSQDTIIITAYEIERDLALYSLRPVLKTMLGEKIPPPATPKAKSYQLGEVLSSDETYYENLDCIMSLIGAYATVQAGTPLNIANVQARFSLRNIRSHIYVQPVIANGADIIVVFDLYSNEWGYINPSNDAYKDDEVFAEVEAAVKHSCVEAKRMKGFPIMLTSYYHRDYPRIHLLMAMFHLSKLFAYAIKLPLKIIYGEREFRGFCREICLQLQLVNAKYNLQTGLVHDNGYLKSGAFVSYASPVQYERSIVPFDQCPYCKKRGYKNLGRHICMAHGGQSSSANFFRHLEG